MNRTFFYVVTLVFLSVTCASATDEILVAAASDLQFVLPEVAHQFEKETGARVKLTFGSSGNFVNQIKNGAPFDVFFSADLNYPKMLDAAGLVEPGTLYHYANGKIVLWATDKSKNVAQWPDLLLDPAVQKVAIANPQHAPYGRAAVEALKHEKIYDRIESKLVLGENISQTAQFVQSGAADVGIVAMSLVLAPALQKKGTYAEIPPQDYSLIEQGCMVLKTSQHKQLAERFLAFLKHPSTIAMLRYYGFETPTNP